jgi:hypothetical protein
MKKNKLENKLRKEAKRLFMRQLRNELLKGKVMKGNYFNGIIRFIE